MKNLNKISVIFSFSMLVAAGSLCAQSQTHQIPSEEKKEKKESALVTKDNSELLDTKQDKAMDLYLQPPATPNQNNSSKTEEKPKASAPR